MRVFFVALFSLLLSLNATAQDTSRIYDAKGRLIADTSFSISKKQLKRFKPYEDLLLNVLVANIKYPEVEREAYIEGTVIVSFTIGDSGKIKAIQMEKGVAVEKNMPGGSGLYKEISRVLKYITVLKSFNTKGIENMKYYIAVNFSKVDKKDVDSKITQWTDFNNGFIKVICLPIQPVSGHAIIDYMK